MKILAKEIEMIASFKKDGVIVPRKFKITGDDEEEITIKVDKVITMSNTKLAGIKAVVFSCQSQIGEVVRRYEIKYRVDEHRWELYKM
jgi:hypothetical protein